jgi:hypothetical protein
MPEDAAAIWRACVGCMRPGWVGGEAFDLLARYCFAMADSAKLEGEMLATPMTDPMRPRLVKQYREMSQLALSYGRALRLAPKDNARAKVDGRDNGRGYEAAPGDARARSVRRQIQPYEL